MANSTFETPAEKRRHVAVSAASCVAARVGEPVELGAPAEFGRAPLGLDPAAAFKAIKSRVEGALLDQDRVAGGVLDESRDGIAVPRASR